MCESYNLQYGTNYIAVMPTNLYGPNDNFHLENSHVMPAMMRKIFLAKLLHDRDWDMIRKDLSIRPVGANLTENKKIEHYTIDGSSEQTLIEKILAFYGIENNKVTRSEDHTSELQSRQYLHSLPTRHTSDLLP